MASEGDCPTEDPRVARSARYGGNLQTFEKLAQVHNIAVETAIRVEEIRLRMGQQDQDARKDTLRINELEKTVAVMAATRTSERNTLAWVWNVLSAIVGGAITLAVTYFTTKHS